MKEADLVGPLLSDLREWRSVGVFLKHADFATVGIPDISATLGGRTTWVECKLLEVPARQTEFDPRRLKIPKLQMVIACQLARAGRCFFVVWVRERRTKVMRHFLLNPWTLLRARSVRTMISYAEGREGTGHREILTLIEKETL